MSIQRPIEEKRLSEIFNHLEPERISTPDPDREFDQFFEKMFGWDTLGKDRYKLYREFLRCNGDLAYLTWIENILLRGNELVKSIREDLSDGAREAKSTRELRNFIKSPFMDYVGGWIVARTAQSIKGSAPSNEWLEKSSDSIVHEACCQAFAYFLYNSNPAKQSGLRKVSVTFC
jgi:hypothetical protein